jgi:hypothetical protein
MFMTMQFKIEPYGAGSRERETDLGVLSLRVKVRKPGQEHT